MIINHHEFCTEKKKHTHLKFIILFVNLLNEYRH